MFQTKRKGISPLIASVLLVAFTMAIAGIMAAWATTFSEDQLGAATNCVFAINILDLDYDQASDRIAIRLENANTDTNLTGLKGSVIYQNQINNLDSLRLSDWGAKDPLGTIETTTIIINATAGVQPIKVEVSSSSCPAISKNF